jgi:predicted nucleic acid-binding protein
LKYLVDANVLSEPTKPQPITQVIDWLRVNERQLVVDPIVLGEIRFGIHIMRASARRRQLEHWFTEGIEKIQCLPWQAATGLRWAKLLADLRVAGRAMPIKDSLIAATALFHDLTMVTRNTRDFVNAGLKVLDPFEA